MKNLYTFILFCYSFCREQKRQLFSNCFIAEIASGNSGNQNMKLLFRTIVLTFSAMLFLNHSGYAQNSMGPLFPSTASSYGPYESAWTDPYRICKSDLPATTNLGSTTSYSDYLTGNFNFAIPPSSTITGIKLIVNRGSSFYASITDYEIRLVGQNLGFRGDNKAKATRWPTSPASVEYGGLGDLWNTTWTPEMINDPNFGAAIAITGTGSALVYYIQIIVYYSCVESAKAVYEKTIGTDAINTTGLPDLKIANMTPGTFLSLDLTGGENINSGETVYWAWGRATDLGYFNVQIDGMVSGGSAYTNLGSLFASYSDYDLHWQAFTLPQAIRYLKFTVTGYEGWKLDAVTYACGCTVPATPGVSVENLCGYSVLTATGYTGDLLWSTGETTSSISVNTTGTYTVTQRNGDCLSIPGLGTASPKPIPVTPVITVQDDCGSTVLTATGYTGSLLWSTGETASSITVTSNGTYWVKQTVDGCESEAGVKNVAIKVSPVATAPAPSAGDGSENSPYQIATLENLYWISANSSVWDKHFIQTADIDASATAGWCNGGWQPIGNSYNFVFSGRYDGQNHTISGLHISTSTSDGYGLFGLAIGAAIKNLGIVNVDIQGINNGMAGGLVGYTEGVTIDNCYSSGNLAVAGSEFGTGGLAGIFSESSVMSNCYSTCNVSGAIVVGGLVGDFYNSAISDSYYSGGTISGSNVANSSSGGIFGAGNGSLTKCYSTGTIIGFYYTGGLAGVISSGGTISNSYNRASCSNDPAWGAFGGSFAGTIHTGVTINNCYSAGTLTSSMGGFIGTNNGSVLNSFWDTETSNTTFSSGGTGKTTAEMQTVSTFTDAGWDFINIWGTNTANNDGYPYFIPEPICTDGTIALSGGSETQTVCTGTAIMNIRYTIGGGATGASVSPALPAGLSGFYSPETNTYTIGGTPTVGGVYAFTVTTSGSSPCNEATASGTITVAATPAAPVIGDQSFCGYSRLTATDYSGDLMWSTGETNATVDVTISGTYLVTQTVNGCLSNTAEKYVSVSTTPEAGVITGAAATILTGQTLNLTAEGGDPAGTWSSSNTDVATVDASGHVLGVGPGSSIITYTINGVNECEGESDAAEFTVTVGKLISQIFNSSGTFTVPADVISINGKAWGGGGGGAGRNTFTGYAGGGGGGGGFGGGTLAVSPGDIITITVGQGGPGGSVANANGALGGSSIISHPTGSITASGGTGPYAGAGWGSGGEGSFTGAVSNQRAYHGGLGGYRSSTSVSSGGGGGAGDGMDGYTASGITGGAGGSAGGGKGGDGSTTEAPGGGGSAYGGGGGGGSSVVNSTGGNGADGAVILSWISYSCVEASLILSSHDQSNAQAVCAGLPITNITYTVGGGAAIAEATGLPTGVSGVYSNGTFTISGTPSVAGIYPYEVSTSGTTSPCTRSNSQRDNYCNCPARCRSHFR